MLRSRDIKIGVISSIIGSLIFLFLQPLLTITWKFIKEISTSTYSGYVNGIYKNAAHGQNDSLIFMLLYMIMIAVIGLGFMSFFRIRRRYRQLINKSQKEKKDEIIENADQPKKLINFYKYFLSVWYFLLPVGRIVFFSYLLETFVVVQLNTSFNQRINALSPYISELTEKKLKSEWALMKTVEDFQKIDSQIITLGSNAKIELPKNLLN